MESRLRGSCGFPPARSPATGRYERSEKCADPSSPSCSPQRSKVPVGAGFSPRYRARNRSKDAVSDISTRIAESRLDSRWLLSPKKPPTLGQAFAGPAAGNHPRRYLRHVVLNSQNALMGIELLGLAGITPLVLLPSERLPGLPPPPIIVLLWFKILRQVPGRAREG